MATHSILDSTKKALGLDPDYDEFDQEIIMHINSVFSTLQQLGVGPTGSFAIEDSDATWTAFLIAGAHVNNLNVVRSYMYMRVRLMFDPPSTSFTIDSFKAQILEAEWRMNLATEPLNSIDTSPATPENPTPASILWDLTYLNDTFPAGAQIGDRGINLLTGNVWVKN